jgi:hypothetical protein
MWSALLVVAFLGVCGVLIWLSRRVEPHWVSKDGQRFTCRVADLSPQRGGHAGSWNEARVAVNGDALTVAIKPKAFQPRARRTVLVLPVVGRTDSDRGGIIIYLLGGTSPMALRVPKRSRAVNTLDRLAARSSR